MDIETLTFLVQAFIAFMALVGGFSFAVDLIVRPLKKDVERLEVGQGKLESRLDKVESRLDNVESRLDNLEAGQARFNKELQEIKHKLDQVLQVLAKL